MGSSPPNPPLWSPALSSLFGEPYPYAQPSLAALTLLGQQPGYSTLLGASLAGHKAPVVINWQHVRGRFKGFINNLAIETAQLEDGERKQAGVRACLNRHYFGHSSETANSLLIGSWGKSTRVRPSRDVDIIFLLPGSLYGQYQSRTGNRQSALLQEVKNVLLGTYSQTSMRADGQVVVIPFNQTPIEVSPGFRCTDGSIIVCDTNNGGRYITSTAEAEQADLAASDTYCLGNARALARMMKQWQRENNVPLKSFQLERIAVEFLALWSNNQRDHFWYDWMVRDFFAYLIGRANTHIIMPGTCELIMLGSDWLFKAQTAHRHSLAACAHEYENNEISAGQEWQAIFGAPIPLRS